MMMKATKDTFSRLMLESNVCDQSLCPYYHILRSKTKRLHSMGNFSISGGTIKVKIDENSKPIAITHLDDLAINFPGVDLSPSPKAS